MLRSSRRIVPLLGLLALLLVVSSAPAGAIYGWCSKDPVVDIGGKRANIWVSSPNEILRKVTGPTVVTIMVPVGVGYELISTDDGFGFDPAYDVRFIESDRLAVTNLGIRIRVNVRVPADAELPVLVEVTDGNGAILVSASGGTNAWVPVRAQL